MNEKITILVVDDEESIRKVLKARLEREGYTVEIASDGMMAESVLRQKPEISVVITDVKMPGKDGLTFTKEIKQQKHSPKIIVMTGHGEKSTAIEALRIGASDYLEKPFDMDEMNHAVKRVVKEFKMERENEDFVQRLEARVVRVEEKETGSFWYASRSRSMDRVNDWLRVLQRESANGTSEEPSTLIIGESGTGKEGIARMIHNGSRKAKGAWIAVNCANFTEQLLESELFGHEKGSFTGALVQKRGLFELAKGGTLFLDEMGEMDVKLQARLLRVLQEKTFRRLGGHTDITADVRVLAATNQNLMRAIAEGRFREDLYHRLAKVVIELPTLKERQEDLLPMTREFLERAFRARGKQFDGLAATAEAAILNYSWPGNVRELLNVCERTSLLWDKRGKVETADLSLPVHKVSPAHSFENMPGTVTGLTHGNLPGLTQNTDIWSDNETTSSYTLLKKKWSDTFEREYLTGLLERHHGNVTAAAKDAGVDRSNFLRLLRRHHIEAANYRGTKKIA
jgi:two-component system response regulator AtoC